MNSFQLALMRKRNRRYGRALFQNTTTIVDTLRRFIPHICRTISILLQNLEIVTETDQPPTRLERDMHVDIESIAESSLPIFEYRYAHCRAILRQRIFDESPNPNKKLPLPNQKSCSFSPTSSMP